MILLILLNRRPGGSNVIVINSCKLQVVEAATVILFNYEIFLQIFQFLYSRCELSFKPGDFFSINQNHSTLYPVPAKWDYSGTSQLDDCFCLTTFGFQVLSSTPVCSIMRCNLFFYTKIIFSLVLAKYCLVLIPIVKIISPSICAGLAKYHMDSL